MKITHVRVGKLESGPGFNNRRVELEAVLEDGEDYLAAIDDLTVRCEAALKAERDMERLHHERHSLAVTVDSLQRQRDDLRAKVDVGYRIIDAHTKLRDLAEQSGIIEPSLLEGMGDDGPPF